jgi:hypothetical protein
MMGNLENKVLKKKKLDKELNLKVLVNNASERILVEFSSKDGKMVLQKSFQDNYYGRQDAKAFETSIKTIEDLKEHFDKKRQRYDS